MSNIKFLAVSGAAAGAIIWWHLRRRRSPSRVQFFEPSEEHVVKRVLFCRHGEGYHNLKDADGGLSALQIPDAELTERGKVEARGIFAALPSGRLDFKPDIVLVSPLWRTLQTCTLAMAARHDRHTCPVVAMEEVREHNNLNKCNHRRPIQSAHLTTFPEVDFSGIDAHGPPPESEWAEPYKVAFGLIRLRAERALQAIDARPEERIAVFCHATFMRALLSQVLGIAPHHAVQPPRTGQAIEVWRIETPAGERYWEMKTETPAVVGLALRTADGKAAGGEQDGGASK